MPYKDKQKQREYQKEWWKNYYQKPENKKRKSEWWKNYYQKPEGKKKESERNKTYRQIPENKKRRNGDLCVRRKTDKHFRIISYLRSRLWLALNKYTKTGKIKSSKKYGIDWQAIIEYLKPFPEDISLYHIDHIKPLVSFDLTNPKEIKKAFAPENHQWLTIQENLSKGAKIL